MRPRVFLVVAGVGVPRDCFHVKNIAPTNEGPRLSNFGAVMYMVKTFGIKNIVCISPNIPGVGDFSCDGIKAWVAGKGIRVSQHPDRSRDARRHLDLCCRRLRSSRT